MKKYKLTDEIKEFGGITLHRIEAVRDFGNVKAGDKGGWVESEHNLSHDWDCWIYNEAGVYGKAQVYGEARVYGKAWVYGKAEVYGQARVYGQAWVYGEAQVSGEAQVYGEARVFGEAWVCGKAEATGKVHTAGFFWLFTATDKHLKVGCVQKTYSEWEQWLESDETFETPRSTEKFDVIEMAIRTFIKASYT